MDFTLAAAEADTGKEHDFGKKGGEGKGGDLTTRFLIGAAGWMKRRVLRWELT